MMGNSTSTGVRLGSVLKALRQENGWTLAEVSKRTGFAVTTLSKVENGRVSLSYDKLIRLSEGLEVDIARLFASTEHSQSLISGRRSINRLGQSELVSVPNYVYHYISTDVVQKKFNPCLIEPRVRELKDFGPLVKHTGEEFIYVLEGEVEIHTSLYAPITLKAGESAYLDSSMGHAYLVKGDRPCRLLGITSESRPGEAHAESPKKPAPQQHVVRPQPATRKRAPKKKHR